MIRRQPAGHRAGVRNPQAAPFAEGLCAGERAESREPEAAR